MAENLCCLMREETYSENVDGGTVSQWNQFSFAEPIDLERVATVYVNGKEVKDFR